MFRDENGRKQFTHPAAKDWQREKMRGLELRRKSGDAILIQLSTRLDDVLAELFRIRSSPERVMCVEPDAGQTRPGRNEEAGSAGPILSKPGVRVRSTELMHPVKSLAGHIDYVDLLVECEVPVVAGTSEGYGVQQSVNSVAIRTIGFLVEPAPVAVRRALQRLRRIQTTAPGRYVLVSSDSQYKDVLQRLGFTYVVLRDDEAPRQCATEEQVVH